MSQETQYFAASEATLCASNLMAKSRTFYKFMDANAYLEKLSRMWRAYHAMYQNTMSYGHAISFTGEQGELVNLPVNHFRNLATHIVTMITSSRPTMEARAINTDYKSQAQTIIANGVLDYYMREKKLEDAIYKCAEMAIVLGSSYIKMEWNATAGEAYDIDPESGQLNYEGEIEFTTLSPFDVVFDGTKETWAHDWLLVRSFKNRYDLVAKYPELKDKIMGVPTKNANQVYKLAMWSNDDTDDISVYEFYHRRTESVPEGRYMLFVESDSILLDTPIPYRQIPIFRMVAGEIMGTSYGYSPMFDVFPIQEAINSVVSAMMTNANTFGVQNVWIKDGDDVNIASIEGGMNIVHSAEKPEALNLMSLPPEMFQFVQLLVQTAETLSGVNSVARGNPEASLKSGTALALVQSMALQFISGIQRSYVKFIEDVGTALINILKDFANTPKVIALVGKSNRAFLMEFTGEQINSIGRVVVDVGNPLAKTISGRIQMAEQLAQMKLLKNPQQYFQVIKTGNLDVTFEGEMSQLLCVKRENEDMLEGKAPKAMITDQHQLHIEEHSAVLSDPDYRQNEELSTVVTQHIQEHINLLRTGDPQLLQMLGQQPLAPLQPNNQPQANPQQGPPANGQPQPPVHALEGSPMQEMTQPMQGNVQNGENVVGPNGQGIAQPGLPQVNAEMLANPAVQQQSLGNVKE